MKLVFCGRRGRQSGHLLTQPIPTTSISSAGSTRPKCSTAALVVLDAGTFEVGKLVVVSCLHAHVPITRALYRYMAFQRCLPANTTTFKLTTFGFAPWPCKRFKCLLFLSCGEFVRLWCSWRPFCPKLTSPMMCAACVLCGLHTFR